MNNLNPSHNQLNQQQMASYVSTSIFLMSFCYSQPQSYQNPSFLLDPNHPMSICQQLDNYQNNPQPQSASPEKYDYKEKYQYLFQIHQDLMELKNKTIYRKLMTNDEVKDNGCRLFENTIKFLEKNLKSVYIEDLSNLFIEFAQNQNDNDLKNSIKKVLKNKKIQQSSDNEQQKNSIKQQQKKNKNKDKFDNMIDNIAKNLQEIIKE